MPGTPTVVADRQCITGEGPLYDRERDLLYWVDIPSGRVFRYDPTTGEHALHHERDGAIGGFTLEADGALLLFEEAGRVEVLRNGETETVVDGIEGEGDSRFNDVIADPEGRVYCGTMPTEARDGRLYRLDPDGSLTRVRDDVALPNGLGFTPDLDGLYFTESEAKVVWQYDYDRATGDLSNERVFVDTADEAGVPDGLTVDESGTVWSARWDGGCLIGYDETGAAVERVSFPARKVSSITFGGADLATAYVTTALGPAPPSGTATAGSRAEEGAGAGALFELDLGVSGRAPFRSRITTDGGVGGDGDAA
ncbi:MAG: SMP-30/gluconolactonase/LRE family protein [Halobacteriaceae archaeon]